ncbi:mitochondrial protein [Coprinopsis marcescibilis]|uniref:Mitochondrial protein n=1 Tax=Coprinopsis marcescibilis TaxID=230819 RepID=A0A5C3L2R9_COPMA|nr:mitochondrial protein [Coprinopsis marcescibilis]
MVNWLWPWKSATPEHPKPEAHTQATTLRTHAKDTRDTFIPANSTSTWPWNRPSEPKTSADLSTPVVPRIDVLVAQSDALLDSWLASSTVLAVVAAGTGGLLTLGFGYAYGRYGKRLRNSEWITPDWLGGKRWVRGIVTNVGDGDNFRLFHTPRFGGYHWPLKWRPVPSKAKALKDETLHVRLAGVDAPEASHFGKEAQPFANEAIDWLTNYVGGRKVYCQLIRKDQYSRVIANVYRPYRFIPGSVYKGKNISREILSAGFASVYEQAGAEYGPYGKEHFQQLEATAKKARRGQWAKPGQRESPADYKRRHSQTDAKLGTKPDQPSS